MKQIFIGIFIEEDLYNCQMKDQTSFKQNSLKRGF